MSRSLRFSAIALLLLACSGENPEPQLRTSAAAEQSVCDPPRVTGRFAKTLHEASGVARGLTDPTVQWVLADDGPPVLFALDSTGSVRNRVAVRNARNVDWESLAAARCDSINCLYIGDLGDNLYRRSTVRIYRIPEPRAGETDVGAEAFDFRYPDGPHDAEALFILPDEHVFVVTKGRREPITVYHYPGPLRSDSTMMFQPVQRLSESFVQLPEMVTGAGSTPNGHWIALRTYSSVQLYHLLNGQLVPQLPGRGIALDSLQEPQGEGVDIAADGSIVLVSEEGLDEGRAPLSRTACRLKSAE
jgi:hypothetical protein